MTAALGLALAFLATDCATKDATTAPGAGSTAPARGATPQSPRSWPTTAVLLDICRAAPAEPPPPGWKAGERYVDDLVLYTAHPDDESMYAGGTLARVAARQRKVTVVVASHGEGGRLLAPLPDGGFEAHRGLPLEHVVRIRDEETRLAAEALGVTIVHLHPALARLDYAFTTSCDEALSTWQRTLPDGLSGILARMVGDLRTRRPHVVVTLDRRDDPEGSRHGHHRAIGALAELAARYAASDLAPELGPPVVVEELLVLVPKGIAADVTIDVDPTPRRLALHAYASQFKPTDISGFGSRPSEGFLLVWRARGAPESPAHRSRLEELVE